MLLFPVKAWLRGFLPGHTFTWEEQTDDKNGNEIQKVAQGVSKFKKLHL